MIRAGTRVAAPPQRGTTRIGALGEGRPPIGIGSTDRPRLLLRGELGGPSIRRLEIPWLFRLRDKPYNWPLSTFRCTSFSLTALRARRSCIGNCLVDAASFFHPSDVATGPITARDEDELGDVSLLHCSKYPPAEPGALVLEPLEAAYPCRSSQASLHSVNASPSTVPPQLGKLR